MFEKLENIEKRYDDINAQLADPAVASDLNNYRKLNKERVDIAELVETFREYKKIVSDIAGNKDILESEDDEDILRLAKDELDELERDKEYLEKKLKLLLLPKDPNDEKISFWKFVREPVEKRRLFLPRIYFACIPAMRNGITGRQKF